MNTIEEKTLPQLCEELGFKVQMKKAKMPHNASEWQKGANSWLAVISYNGNSMAVPYFTGKALKRAMTASDVVHSLSSDWNTWKSCEDVKGFAGEFGWDENTLSTWEAVERQAKEWEHFVGDETILETLARVEY